MKARRPFARHPEPPMTKGRLEAFSDGVFAIIITIMVLEFKAPEESSFEALLPLKHPLLSYAMSFIFVGIYWNNHHHLLQAARHVNGAVLWANLHLLFWLSLVPFVTSWMGASHFAAAAVAVYGCVLLMAGVAYFILARILVAAHGRDSHLAIALGRDTKGKLSVVIYAAAIAISFVNALVASILYLFVAAIWLIPDRRIESVLLSKESDPGRDPGETH
jgi:uncharacterized membrane protein